MINLDEMQAKRQELLANIQQSAKDGDNEKFGTAMAEYSDYAQQIIIAEAKGMLQNIDQTVLAGRGVRSLTSEETEYYNSLAGALKSSNPQQALAELDEVLPVTTIDRVFEDLIEAHPLLNEIKFQNTGALVEIIVNNGFTPLATWGELCGTIATEIHSGFDVINLAQKKLSAFMPVCNAMLDLGPVWLDRYVRAILGDALLGGLEKEIVDGDGKNGPIGMTRKLTGAVDGVYARKTPITLDSLDPVTYGDILKTLVKVEKSLVVGGETKTVTRYRPVTNVVMIVNPEDYFDKVFPATTVRRTDGGYNTDVLPFPTKIIQSAHVPAGNAIIGLADKYFAFLGTGKAGKLEYSDEYQFLEDKRVYKIKLYGNGTALLENDFVLADISNLKATVQKVEVTNIADTPVA